jgi:hypothetical protein
MFHALYLTGSLSFNKTTLFRGFAMTNDNDQLFNETYKLYTDKFGIRPPVGIDFPDLTIELMQKAINSGIEIAEYELPKGAVS